MNHKQKKAFQQAQSALLQAKQILQENNLAPKQAAQISGLLQKTAQQLVHDTQPEEMKPLPLPKLMEKGFTQKDLMELGKGSPTAKAKLNKLLRHLGYNEYQIVKMIGLHNFLSKKDSEDLLDPNRSLGKVWDWMQNPTQKLEIENEQPETLEFESLLTPKSSPSPVKEDELMTFKSMASFFKAAAQELHDWHIQNLTPEKQVENLKHHGTVFNMAEDDALSELDLDENEAMDVGWLEEHHMDFEEEI